MTRAKVYRPGKAPVAEEKPKKKRAAKKKKSEGDD